MCALANLEISDVVDNSTTEYLTDNTSNMSSIMTVVCGLLFVIVMAYTIYTIYRCSKYYMCLIYHYISPYDTRPIFLKCFSDDSYINNLVWIQNKYASCVIIPSCCIIGILGNMLTSNDIVNKICDGAYLYFPILFFACRSLHDTFKASRTMKGGITLDEL